MKISIPTATWVSLLVSAVVLVGTGVSVVDDIQDAMRAASLLKVARGGHDWLEHLYRQLHVTQESGGSYLVHGDAQQLATYRSNAVELEKAIPTSLLAFDDGHEPEDDLARLESEIRDGLDRFDAAIAARRDGGFEAARAFLDNRGERQGFPLSDALAHTDAALLHRSDQIRRAGVLLDHEMIEMVWGMAAAGALCLLLQAWVYALMRRLMASRDTAQHALRSQNAALADAVAQATRRVVAKNRELSFISRKALQIQEQEKRCLATTLHDEIGQSVAALLLNLRRLDHRAGADRNEAPETVIAQCIEIVEEIYTRLSDIALRLRPSVLDRLGLVPALEWYARQQGQRAGCPITVRAQPIGRDLPEAIATAAFRIVQEAISNALRHAAARHISIEAGREPDRLYLAICDDGRGFDPVKTNDDPHPFSGFGLLGMRERAAMAGGRLQIVSRPGYGTSVFVEFDIEAPRHAERASAGGAGAGAQVCAAG